MVEKTLLRARINKEINNLDAEYAAESDRGIRELLFTLKEFKEADTVFAFFSLSTEVDTHAVIDKCLSLEKRVALPVTMPHGAMEFREYLGVRFMEKGALGILQPKEGCEIKPGENDVILAPGLCFDADGFRLGKGGGYYDRYLAEHPAFTVGLCRHRFFNLGVPRRPWDIAVNCVVTEKKIARPV